MLLNQYKLILIIYLLAKQQASNLFALPASLSLYVIYELALVLIGKRESNWGYWELR